MMHQAAGQGEALPHAAAELSNDWLRAAGRLPTLQHLLDALLLLLATHAIDVAEKLHVFAGRQVEVERIQLCHIPDMGCDPGTGYALIQDMNCTACRAYQAYQHANKRRLTRAVGAYQSISLTGIDTQAKIIYSSQLAKLLDELIDNNHRFAVDRLMQSPLSRNIRSSLCHRTPPTLTNQPINNRQNTTLTLAKRLQVPFHK